MRVAMRCANDMGRMQHPKAGIVQAHSPTTDPGATLVALGDQFGQLVAFRCHYVGLQRHNLRP
jgi:hypothetical protein